MIETKSYKIFSQTLFFLNDKQKLKLYKGINFIKNFSFWYIGLKKYDLIIFDDIFPSNNSPWRTNEFVAYLRTFSKVKIISNSSSKTFLKGSRFSDRLIEFSKKYPEYRNNVKREAVFVNVNAKVLYFIFYNNLTRYIDKVVEKKIPFLFTLYPGGGWEFFNPEKDKRIKEIIESNFCLGVIVNQHVTYNYLIDQLMISPKKIRLIPGVPLPSFNNKKINQSFPKGEIVRICFVAHKYLENGADKGLPIFVEFIKKLEAVSSITFQAFVIGDFSNSYFENSNRISFLGKMDEDKLNEFLEFTDCIISPNQPFKLSKGAYDGFPLGTIIAAALNNNLIFSTDFFDEGSKIGFIDRIHFVKIDPDPDDILNKFQILFNGFNEWSQVIVNSKSFAFDFYSYDKQIVPRINLFKTIIE